MATFQVMINEQQRAILARAVRSLSEDGAFGDGEEGHEALILADMLDALPADEAAHPGVLHGLCL